MASIKLYVGNLPWSVTSDELGQKFSEAGNVVSAQVITDKYSGRSRGFAFVEMDSQEAADKAIELFNEKDMDGRNIVVNIARPRDDSSQGGSAPARGPADDRSAPSAGGQPVWDKPDAEAPSAQQPAEEKPPEEPTKE